MNRVKRPRSHRDRALRRPAGAPLVERPPVTMMLLTAIVFAASSTSDDLLLMDDNVVNIGRVTTATTSDSIKLENAAAGCFMDPKLSGITYKSAPGNVFPDDPTHQHGLRLTNDAAGCCALCQSLKNCSFFTYSDGGVVGKPRCYATEGQGCCFLKTAEGGKNPGAGCSACISGSTKPLQPPPSCRNGTECGGTNEWTTWHDTSLPNSSCTADWCN